MAMNIKSLFATPESRTSLMLISGILSLLGSLAVAIVIWQRWNETGVQLGPKRFSGVIIVSIVTTALAAASGIWALREVDSLTGPSSVKCSIAVLFDALALAILMAFVIVAYFLKVA